MRRLKVKQILTVASVISFIAVMPIKAIAAQSDSGEPILTADENTKDTTYGLVQIEIGYLFDDGSFDMWASYPGFAVNKNTVLTEVNNVITIAESSCYANAVATKKEGYAEIGIDITNFDSIKSSIVCRINDGVADYLYEGTIRYIGDAPFAAIITDSDLSSYALLSSEDIAKDSSENYAVGYSNDVMGGDTYASSGDILMQSVSVAGINDKNITIGLNSSEDFIGGPLVTENGAVEGIVLSDSKAYSVSGIKNYLDKSEISYELQKSDEETDFSDLQVMLDSAKAIDTENYSAESKDTLNELLKKAEVMIEEKSATQEEAEALRTEISSAIGNLSEKNLSISKIFANKFLIIGIAAAIVAAYFVIKALRKKRLASQSSETYGYIDPESKEEIKSSEENVEEIHKKENHQASEPEINVENSTSLKETPQDNKIEDAYKPSHDEMQKELPSKKKAHEVTDHLDYAEENLTLDAEDEGILSTTLLAAKPPVSAYLVRQQTGEKAYITKSRFVLGKDRTRADFIITGNKTVSRMHAEIYFDNGYYYIRDLNSTNHTFVDGNIVTMKTKYKLTNGTVIGLSDEDLIFYIDQ